MSHPTTFLYNELIASLGVQSADEGYCALVFDEDLTVSIEARTDNQCLVYCAVVGELPPGDDGPLLRQLLALNLPLMRHRGISLGLEEQSNTVMLHMDAHQTSTELLQADLAVLLDQTELCRKLLVIEPELEPKPLPDIDMQGCRV